MRFVFYPDLIEHEAVFPLNRIPNGVIAKELQYLLEKQIKLYVIVKEFLIELEKVTDLSIYYKSERLRDLGDGLHEMRIPKKRRGGVFRLYFCYHNLDVKSDVLILLDAELKHKKKPQRMDIARDKLKEYKDLIRQGEKHV